MSLYGLVSSSDSQVYQYAACIYGVEKHHYYHKCDDCAYTTTCEIRQNMLAEKTRQKVLASIKEYNEEQKHNSRILDSKRLP